MNYKKIISISLMSIAFSFVGCSGSASDNGTTNNGDGSLANRVNGLFDGAGTDGTGTGNYGYGMNGSENIIGNGTGYSDRYNTNGGYYDNGYRTDYYSGYGANAANDETGTGIYGAGGYYSSLTDGPTTGMANNTLNTANNTNTNSNTENTTGKVGNAIDKAGKSVEKAISSSNK